MPVIFNDENYEIIRKKIIENGFEILKKYGIKKMTITDITERSGFAKSTFYTFFPSKEEFIREIVLYKREQVNQSFLSYADENGMIGKNEFLEFLSSLNINDLSVYQYLNKEDLNYLTTKWPKEYCFNPEADKVGTMQILSKLKGLSKDANWKVFANFMKLLANMDMCVDYIHADAVNETRQVFINGMIEYLFKP